MKKAWVQHRQQLIMFRPGKLWCFGILGIMAMLTGCIGPDASMFISRTSQTYVSTTLPTDGSAKEAVSVRFEYECEVDVFAGICLYVCDEGGGLAPNGKLGCYYPPSTSGGVPRGMVYFFQTPDNTFNNLKKATIGDGADQKSYWTYTHRTGRDVGPMSYELSTVKIAPYDKNRIPGNAVTVVGRVAVGQPIEWRRAPGEMKLDIIYSGQVTPVSLHAKAGNSYLVKLTCDKDIHYRGTVITTDGNGVAAESSFPVSWAKEHD